MSQIVQNQSYLMIEDRLDLLGQKYRVQQILRGAMIWLAVAMLSSLAATLAAHFIGQGGWTRIILYGWIAVLIATTWRWIARPLLIRPDPLKVARFVEDRVDGLHNGLTNSLLLSQRDDIQRSPWLPEIFDEVLSSTRTRPLESAIKIRDLSPLAIRLALLIIPAAALAFIFRGPLAHGWEQVFHPAAFVPKVGQVRITQIQPGNTTLVAGQALEILVSADGPGNPLAKLFIDGAAHPTAKCPAGIDLTAQPKAPQDPSHHYNYRLDHVDDTLRYRVEVGGTQSQWYTVTVVKQVKLTELSVRIIPPLYTGIEAKSLALKADEIGKMPIAAPQGSQIELGVALDVSVGGAMFQMGSEAAPPISMTMSDEGKRFATAFTIKEDTPLVILLTAGTGQIIERLPAEELVIKCTNDAPPIIEMNWPAQDVSVTPDQELKITALLKDDYSLASSRVLMALGAGESSEDSAAQVADDLKVVSQKTYPPATASQQLAFTIPLDKANRKHGQSLRVRVEATDNRDLTSISKSDGPQTTLSSVFVITFRDPAQIAKEEKDRGDKLRQRLLEMLKLQQSLHAQTAALKPEDASAVKPIQKGQDDLRMQLQQTAETFEFEESDLVVQKTLLALAYNPAKEAVDLAAVIADEPLAKERRALLGQLATRQRRIISTLESLLALLKNAPEPTTQPTREGGDIPGKKEAYEKLKAALGEYIKQQQRILDQTAHLAKRPVDDFTDADRKKLEELTMAQEKLDSFMQEKIADFSKLAEQDMANASLLKELLEVYSEVTMAKGALKEKAMEIAVAAEDMGLELAKEINSNLEKWLLDKADRQKWTQEDPINKTDTPMAELPTEMEDMVGELLEEQEDLFDEMEDANANWTDSGDKGIGWDAADGPVANMSAKGVTGNQLPNNNEMGGRSGEGRSGKSQGEMVEDSATGKGGRDTPTRLDPTPFQQGQINNQSKDPVGGATGGGKISGQGGAGLEGPVPPKLKEQMDRLAQKQAQLRNNAERLNLKYKVGRYDNFKLLNAIALMRRVEADIKANRYQNMLRRKEVLIDSLDTSKLLLGSQVHVQQDTSPAPGGKLQEQINDAMKGELPPAWSDALKEYYKKLAEE